MSEIKLDTSAGCRDELQTCANGIAELMPKHTKLRLELGELDERVEIAEALITAEMFVDAPRMTATDRKAQVIAEMDRGPAGTDRRRRYEVKAKLDVIDRRFRSLEKRMSAAQSALNDHQAEARSAGFANQ